MPAGVLITTPRIHLRGVNREKVVVDGTKPGSAKCSREKSAQNLGPKLGKSRRAAGLNGIMVYEAGDVSVQNVTACNFLGGAAGDGQTGNEIWWNGGAGSGKIGGGDTVMDNLFVRNGAWGTIFVPFPDSGPPCTGGTQTGVFCLYDEYGDALLHNRYARNGFLKNQTNGDFGAFNLEPNGKTDCYRGNEDVGGGAPKTSPSDLQQMYPKCKGAALLPNLNPVFVAEVACDSEISFSPAGKVPCAPGMHYPRRKKVVMHPLPRTLKTMPNPCAGVPKNPWCKG